MKQILKYLIFIMFGIILYSYINSYNTFSIGGRLIRYYTEDQIPFYYNTITHTSTWEPEAPFRETIEIIDTLPPENVEPPSEPPQKWICNISNHSCEVSVDSSNDDSGSEGWFSHGTLLFDDYHTCDQTCKNRIANPGITLEEANEEANEEFESTRTTICPNTQQLEPEPEPEPGSETTPRRVNIDYLQKCKYTLEAITQVQELFDNFMITYNHDLIYDITFTMEQIILLLKTNLIMISWRRRRKLFHSNFLDNEILREFLGIANGELRSPTDTTNIRNNPDYQTRYINLPDQEIWKIINYDFDEIYTLLLIDANAYKLGHDIYVMNTPSRDIFTSRLNELYNIRYPYFHILHTTLIEAMEGRNTLTIEQIEDLLNHYQQNIFLLNQRELEYLHEQREINLACAANQTEEGIPPDHD